VKIDLGEQQQTTETTWDTQLFDVVLEKATGDTQLFSKLQSLDLLDLVAIGY